jgi:choloylglycine hydrolase
MKLFTFITIGLWALAQLASPNLEGCTGIKLVAKDGAVVTGRTVEFGVYIPSSIAIVPRNYEFTGTTPNGNGLKYTTKYGAVGVIADGEVSVLDGINEKGLSVGTFYFPGFAEYATIDSKNQAKASSLHCTNCC